MLCISRGSTLLLRQTFQIAGETIQRHSLVFEMCWERVTTCLRCGNPDVLSMTEYCDRFTDVNKKCRDITRTPDEFVDECGKCRTPPRESSTRQSARKPRDRPKSSHRHVHSSRQTQYPQQMPHRAARHDLQPMHYAQQAPPPGQAYYSAVPAGRVPVPAGYPMHYAGPTPLGQWVKMDDYAKSHSSGRSSKPSERSNIGPGSRNYTPAADQNGKRIDPNEIVNWCPPGHDLRDAILVPISDDEDRYVSGQRQSRRR